MKKTDNITNANRHIVATLLIALPVVTAVASYAHGHGSMSGSALGLVISLCIAAGAWGAYLLFSPDGYRTHTVETTVRCH